MKNEIEKLQQSFQEARKLLDDALDILTRRDDDNFTVDDMHVGMNKLFKLRDKYFLGFNNWDCPKIHVQVTGQINAEELLKKMTS